MIGFRSNRATFGPSSLIHESVDVLGPVELHEHVLVEAGVQLGHPVQTSVDAVWEANPEISDLNVLYDLAAKHVTYLGDGSIVRSNSCIYEDVYLGAHSQVAHGCVVREGSRLGKYVAVWPNTSIRRSARIDDGCRVAGVVGDRAHLEPYATSLGSLVHTFRAAVGGEVEDAPVVRTGAVIGRGATVVGGVEVGQFAVVAAGSLVARDVAPMTVVAGNPAKVVGRRGEAEVERVRSRIARGEFL